LFFLFYELLIVLLHDLSDVIIAFLLYE